MRQTLLVTINTASKHQYSQQGGETACSGWSLLSSPGRLNFCAAFVDTWADGEIINNRFWVNVNKRLKRKKNTLTHAQEVLFMTYCEHSAVFPLLWKSIIHWISWLFSSSSCKSKCRESYHMILLCVITRHLKKILDAEWFGLVFSLFAGGYCALIWKQRGGRGAFFCVKCECAFLANKRRVSLASCP